MRIDIITLFPRMFQGPLGESILQRAQEQGLVQIHLHNPRDYTTDRHRSVDDYPYGGSAGMVLKPEPLFAALEALLGRPAQENASAAEASVPVILLSPQGRLFHQGLARELAARERLVLLCGRYEGVDERVREHLVTDELSIGDYVLTGGELAAMVVVDAVTRCLPGALGSPGSLHHESHWEGLLEHPHYTRPRVFRGWVVPAVLLSGDHGAIARWRREQSLQRTLRRRPDLLKKAPLTEQDHAFLRRLQPPPDPSALEL